MAAAHDWWTVADTRSMLRLAFDGACIVVAWASAQRCNMWSQRYRMKARENARLRAADQNRRANARALPAAPKRKPPAPRTRFRWISWPGDNTGQLPIPPYGTEREHLETDPCAPAEKRPAPLWLREWLEQDEPFLATTRELVIVEGLARNIEWHNPPVWVVPHLQETK